MRQSRALGKPSPTKRGDVKTIPRESLGKPRPAYRDDSKAKAQVEAEVDSDSDSTSSVDSDTHGSESTSSDFEDEINSQGDNGMGTDDDLEDERSGSSDDNDTVSIPKEDDDTDPENRVYDEESDDSDKGDEDDDDNDQDSKDMDNASVSSTSTTSLSVPSTQEENQVQSTDVMDGAKRQTSSIKDKMAGLRGLIDEIQERLHISDLKQQVSWDQIEQDYNQLKADKSALILEIRQSGQQGDAITSTLVLEQFQAFERDVQEIVKEYCQQISSEDTKLHEKQAWLSPIQEMKRIFRIKDVVTLQRISAASRQVKILQKEVMDEILSNCVQVKKLKGSIDKVWQEFQQEIKKEDISSLHLTLEDLLEKMFECSTLIDRIKTDVDTVDQSALTPSHTSAIREVEPVEKQVKQIQVTLKSLLRALYKNLEKSTIRDSSQLKSVVADTNVTRYTYLQKQIHNRQKIFERLQMVVLRHLEDDELIVAGKRLQSTFETALGQILQFASRQVQQLQAKATTNERREEVGTGDIVAASMEATPENDSVTGQRARDEVALQRDEDGLGDDTPAPQPPQETFLETTSQPQVNDLAQALVVNEDDVTARDRGVESRVEENPNEVTPNTLLQSIDSATQPELVPPEEVPPEQEQVRPERASISEDDDFDLNQTDEELADENLGNGEPDEERNRQNLGLVNGANVDDDLPGAEPQPPRDRRIDQPEDNDDDSETEDDMLPPTRIVPNQQIENNTRQSAEEEDAFKALAALSISPDVQEPQNTQPPTNTVTTTTTNRPKRSRQRAAPKMEATVSPRATRSSTRASKSVSPPTQIKPLKSRRGSPTATSSVRRSTRTK